ncbi:tetratricopeptide repeat protein [Temperatibacter marinus]|uniref:Tetratricopeptide repeat protein n=1 Tax=Temperatibacter marinus TaxID=1456591 RepID=A0AA52EIT5_9PROT|nr:tetratricopeptide repeat protein [Temperatibacter marinus]WND03289.1 tetratricopeptide repeat protein [Temperatibacter marinus]
MSNYIGIQKIVLGITACLLIISPVWARDTAEKIVRPSSMGSGGDKTDINKIRSKLFKRLDKIKSKARTKARAKSELAEYYRLGIGVQRNKQKAFDLYNKAYKAGDPVAQYYMGEFYLYGLDFDNDGILDFKKDPEKGKALKKNAMKGIAKLAKKEDGEALYLMGMAHKSGRYGLKKDLKKARKYFDDGREEHYPKAQYQYGEFLLKEGRKKHPKACDQFARSAAVDFGPSINAIAYCLLNGRGRKQNRILANKWYQFGAQGQSIQSMVLLAERHARADDEQNYIIAADFYKKALQFTDKSDVKAWVYSSMAKNAYKKKKSLYYNYALGRNLENKSYINEVQNSRGKTDDGRDRSIGLEPGIYTRDYILDLAKKANSGHKGAAEYVKDFVVAGYIKSLENNQFRTLKDNLSKMGTHKNVGFQYLALDTDSQTLSLVHNFSHTHIRQEYISKWDVKTGELIHVEALNLSIDVMTISKNGQYYMTEERHDNFWEHQFIDVKHVLLKDTRTHKVIHKLSVSQKKHTSYDNARFLGSDKFLEIDYQVYDEFLEAFRRENRLFSVETGEVLSTDRGAIRRKISPDGQHIIRIIRVKDENSEGEVVHSKFPEWSDGEIISKDNMLRYGFFTPDSRYFVIFNDAYELKTGVMHKGHATAINTFIQPNHIPNTNLVMVRFKNYFSFYANTDDALIKVKDVPLDIKWKDTKQSEKISTDFGQVAFLGVREGGDTSEIYIQSIHLPTEEEVTKSIADYRISLKKDKEFQDVAEMYEVGFVDQALVRIKSIIDASPGDYKPALDLLKKRMEIDASAISQAMQYSITVALGMENDKGVGTAADQLYWYGLLANSAGHPQLADIAADWIEERKEKLTSTKGGVDRALQQIALLRSLALSKQGKTNEAYNLLFSEAAFKSEEQWAIRHIEWETDLFADIFAEPKKLAYILGKNAEDLPKLPKKRVKPSAFWTLDGRLISLGEDAVEKQDGGAVID